MDCNKEEAIRAKETAEKKMQSNDFQGAQKIALKAKQLFPELENISQLLTVCDVHCSAQNKIGGSEKDWYGILQVERLADEVTIKKQYRKLAFILHPDKNKFPGAEAAFKLIGEANMVLSDQGKRSFYDNKCRASVRTAVTKRPPHQVNQNPGVRNPYGIQTNIPNVSNYKFSGLNLHQTTQSDLSKGSQTFWTCCPFCNIKYMYNKDFVNRALRCQNCSKPFIAYDLGTQGAPLGSNKGQPNAQGVTPGFNWGRPTFSQPKQVPNQADFKVGAQSTGVFPSSHLGSEANSSRTVGSEPVSNAEVGGGLKTKRKEHGPANTEDGKEGVGMPKVDAPKPRESGTSRHRGRKKGRKLVVESSESYDTSNTSDTEEVVMEETGGNSAPGHNSRLDSLHRPRRSSRQRHQVSYNENVSDDDDFMSATKKSRESKSSIDGEDVKKEAALGNEKFKVDDSAAVPDAVDVDEEKIKKRSAPPEGSLPNGNGVAGKHQVNGEGVTLDAGAKTFVVIDDSESNSDLGCNSNTELYDCLDPEFSDFDKDKEEKCFSVDQIWACYDTIDGMPRFYAQIKKVFSPGFKLRITWLEANPEDQGKIDWVTEGLPVACGKFIRGSTDETSDRLTFSHQMHWDRGSSRGSYVIYPRKGETWALFKDWDIRWSSEPENHKNYKFEIVEVLPDFGNDAGIRVAYIEKVKGFVSLFQRTSRGGIASFVIPSSQLLIFSHRIPSFKMTGTERAGVPKGSFELDPASLPNNLNELSP